MKAHEGMYGHLAAVPHVSGHARQRLRQRGLCGADLERLLQYGEEFSDGYLMSDRAIGERVAMLKGEIQRLERLKSVVLIEQDDTLVTVYRADRKRCRRILNRRNARQRQHSRGT